MLEILCVYSVTYVGPLSADPLRAGHHDRHGHDKHAGGAVVQPVDVALGVGLQDLLPLEDRDVLPQGAEQGHHGRHGGGLLVLVAEEGSGVVTWCG